MALRKLVLRHRRHRLQRNLRKGVGSALEHLLVQGLHSYVAGLGNGPSFHFASAGSVGMCWRLVGRLVLERLPVALKHRHPLPS